MSSVRLSENAARADELSERWLKVDEVAALLGFERGFVYDHARELGGRKIGNGPKAPWRFRLEDVLAATSCQTGRSSDEPDSGMVEPVRRQRRRGGSGTGVPLLPIRGGGQP